MAVIGSPIPAVIWQSPRQRGSYHLRGVAQSAQQQLNLYREGESDPAEPRLPQQLGQCHEQQLTASPNGRQITHFDNFPTININPGITLDHDINGLWEVLFEEELLVRARAQADNR